MSAIRWLVLLACLAGLPGTARAHDAVPMLVSVQQSGDALYAAAIVVPPSIAGRFDPVLQMPAACRRISGASQVAGSNLYRCARPPGGGEARLVYAGSAPSVPVLVQMRWQTGEMRSLLLEPGQVRFTLPSQESAAGVAGQYLRLGVEHILFGFDHLLFVVCLLWLAGTARRILIMITGFTLAHSLTLAAAALGLVDIPGPPVEALIALSIVFLAAEIFRGAGNTLTWRYPVAVSASFGLLHGLGFGSALARIGLPQVELVTGLLFFNLGVEAGQILFVACVTALYLTMRRLLPQLIGAVGDPSRLRLASSAVVGVTASYWFVQRLTAMLA